jgi:hypothetical protein
MHVIKFVVICTLLAVISTSHAEPTPVGSAFTYQGELKQAGELANGPFDFLFILWDEQTDGVSVGGPLELGDVNVQDGVFTVDLDFGTEAFTREQQIQIWLDIRVRDGQSDGEYSLLEPRQKLSMNPYGVGMAARLRTLECQIQGLNYCDGNCVDTRDDTQNCGACGSVCANGETCLESACMQELCPITIDCEDFNACTTNFCDPFTGCVNDINWGQQCDDGNACTTNDQCGDGGNCIGTPTTCEAPAACFVSYCDGQGGCVNELMQNFCFISEQCWAQGANKPGDASLSCQPNIDPYNWLAN